MSFLFSFLSSLEEQILGWRELAQWVSRPLPVVSLFIKGRLVSSLDFARGACLDAMRTL